MALPLRFIAPISLSTHTMVTSQIFIRSVKSIHGRVQRTIRCISVNSKTSDEDIVRRTANYQPSIWDNDYVQSLDNKYVGDKYVSLAMKLKEDVKKMLKEVMDPLDELKMIDDLQRLGIFYHFEYEIKRVLEYIYKNDKHDKGNEDDLYAMSLKFRLLRHYGYNVPQEVFENFMGNTGHFNACLCHDVRGMLYLYEASFLSFRGETILEKARDFTTKNLEQNLKKRDIDRDLALLIDHALELPLHWRMPRLEARWFIDLYERRPSMSPTLLQLAKLDFNMVQATHQADLKLMYSMQQNRLRMQGRTMAKPFNPFALGLLNRWWSKTGLAKKLGFSRDRLVENFLWTIGLNFKPQFSNLRRNMTVVNALITAIDDVYDVYGTLDELEIFTNAVERWDVRAMDQLPDYMKICYLALFNSINEMGYETLKEQGIHIIPHLQKPWADLCKYYLKEAKWYHSGYTPTLQEYMNNAWISVSAPAILVHAYFLCANPITPEGSECSNEYPNIFQWSGTILRLANDLGTSSDEMKRGDTLKSIQCYVHETGASEEDAREHIKYLIRETWKKMNEDRFKDSAAFPPTLGEIAMNLARMSQCMYQYGDGHAGQGGDTKDRVSSLLVDSIAVEY